mmetsp:Transcript_39283/g.76861  ORF Transcript_39283/g.76861 Transcript_39283/m.76861 type:complete len:174 (+) Transcript_39283:108-629(+)
MLHCKVLAPKFGVTPKTVRDIWNGRTWFSATKPYWTKAERQRKAYFASDAYDDVAAADLAAPIIAEQMQVQREPPQAPPPQQHQQHHHNLMGGLSQQKIAEGMMQGQLPYMNLQTQQSAMLYKNNIDNMKNLQRAMSGNAGQVPISMAELQAFAGQSGGQHNFHRGMGLEGIK